MSLIRLCTFLHHDVIVAQRPKKPSEEMCSFLSIILINKFHVSMICLDLFELLLQMLSNHIF